MLIKFAKKIHSLSRFQKFSWFSSSKGPQIKPEDPEMKFLRDRAYLASNVIRQILLEPDSKKITHENLSQCIIQHLQNADPSLCSRARQEVLDHFKDGVQIDQEVFEQVGIKPGEQSKTKIVFYPTRGFFCEYDTWLDDYNKLKRTVFEGVAGISKTYSAMLYARLCNMITEYNFKKYPQRAEEDLNSGIINTPKVVYYNFKLDKVAAQPIKEAIYKQLNPTIRSKLQQNNENWLSELNKTSEKSYESARCLYQMKKIDIVLVVDSIEEYFNLAQNQQRKPKEQKCQKLGSIIRLFQSQMRDFSLHLHAYVYLSYEYSGFNFLSYGELHYRGKSLEKSQIPYPDLLDHEQFMKTTIEIYLFSLKNALSIKFLDKNSRNGSNSFIDKVKLRLQQNLRSIKNDYLINYHFVNQSIDITIQNQKAFFDNNIQRIHEKYNSMTESELLEFIEKQFSDIIGYSKNKLKGYFKQFIETSLKGKYFFKDLMLELYFAAGLALESGKNLAHQSIQLKKYFQVNCIESKEKKIFTTSFGGQKYQMFCQHGDQMNCIIPPSVVRQVLKGYINELLDDQLIKLRIRQHQKNNLSKLIFLTKGQVCLIDVLTSGNQKINFYDKGLDESLRFEQISPKAQLFQEISQSSSTEKLFLKGFEKGIRAQLQELKKSEKDIISSVYLPQYIKQQSTNSGIEKKFYNALKRKNLTQQQKQVLQSCKTHIYKNQINFDHLVQYSGKPIDFFIVEINKHSTISINAFSLATSKLQTYQKRVESFLSHFKQFTDRNQSQYTLDRTQYKVQLTFNVICHKQNTISKQQFEQNFRDAFKFLPVSKNDKVSTSVLQVQSKEDQYRCILKEIRYYDIHNELRFEPEKGPFTLVWKYFKNQSENTTYEMHRMENQIKKGLELLKKEQSQIETRSIETRSNEQKSKD